MTDVRRIGRPPMDPGVRFDTHVNFDGPIPPGFDTPCWLWTGVPSGNGYAQFSIGGRAKPQHVLVHRWNFQRHGGSIPPGWQVDHLCKISTCVNPDHLEAVPGAVNNRRSDSPSAVNARRVLCKQELHELAGANLAPYAVRLGLRVCLECRRQYQRDYRARRRQQKN